MFLAIFGLPACGGGGGIDDDDEDDVDPGGGVGIGDGGATIFWQSLAGPYEGGWGRALDVRQTPDGGFIVTGFFAPAFGEPSEVYLAKTDSSGHLRWSRTFPGNRPWGQANVVRQTPEGGYVLGGYQGRGDDYRFYLLRTDVDGNTLPGWPKTYTGAGGEGVIHGVTDLHPLADGVVYSGQSSTGGYLLAKKDYSGNSLWTEVHFGPTNPGWDAAMSIDRTADGGYIVGGIDNGPRTLVGAVRTDSNGKPQSGWPRTYGEGAAYSVRSTRDGGFVLAGKTTIPWEDGDGLLIKVDSQGNESWRRTFGGARNDEIASVDVTSDGSIIAVGHTDSYSPGFNPEQSFCYRDVFMVKVSASGETLWQKVLGRLPCTVERADSMQALADGGFVIAGESGAQPMIAKMDRTGATVGLGTHEFKLNIPAVSGQINFDNAMLVAGRGAGAPILVRQFAAFGLDRLLIERPIPASLCSGGGTYTPVAAPVLEGGRYTIGFTDCTLNSADPLTINGSLSVRVDRISGTLVEGGNYDITLTYYDIDFVSEDDAGPTRFMGRLPFRRSAAGGLATEEAALSPVAPFVVVEGTTLQALRSGSIDYQLSGNAFTLTSADGVVFELLGLDGDLALAMIEPISGSAFPVPDDGRIRITASDGSSSVLIIMDDAVTIEIDTDGDGEVDGVLRTTWDDLI